MYSTVFERMLTRMAQGHCRVEVVGNPFQAYERLDFNPPEVRLVRCRWACVVLVAGAAVALAFGVKWLAFCLCFVAWWLYQQPKAQARRELLSMALHDEILFDRLQSMGFITVTDIDRPPAAPAATPPTPQPPTEAFASLRGKTKMRWVEGIGWFLFLFFIPSMTSGGNPIGLLIGVVGAITGFRGWCQRRTHVRALAIGTIERYGKSIYIPALWSYAWRSLLAMCGFAVFFGVLGLSIETAAATLGAVLCIWLVGSLLVLDVPYWVLRRLKSETHAA